MALSIKDATNLLGFLDEDEIANQSFDSFGAALQKVGFNKQVRKFFTEFKKLKNFFLRITSGLVLRL